MPASGRTKAEASVAYYRLCRDILLLSRLMSRRVHEQGIVLACSFRSLTLCACLPTILCHIAHIRHIHRTIRITTECCVTAGLLSLLYSYAARSCPTLGNS